MGRKPRLSKKRIADALRKTRGGVYLAADLLSVVPGTVYNYLKKHDDLQELKSSFDGLMVDKAEYNLHEAVQKGEPWALKYALSTKGKERGYTERQEVTGADGEGLTIRVVYANADDHTA